jgi:GNAT superfamily N-acetyltransferase
MITIREGRREDLSQVLDLIKELAEYERALNEVTNTVDRMLLDGFGNNPAFEFYVAEEANRIVGLSLFYYRYSTWKGKRLYLEDIIVTQSERGRGIGKMLFDATMKKCLLENCTGMMWQVLDWNESAIEFYKKFGTRFDSEWVNCHLEATQIQSYLNKP